jgi:uncharacterized membrane protein YtjA (UPF0391 family)
MAAALEFSTNHHDVVLAREPAFATSFAVKRIALIGNSACCVRDLTIAIRLACSLLRKRYRGTLPLAEVACFYALLFFIIAIVAGVLGFWNRGRGAIAKVLFVVFLVLFIVAHLGVMNRRNP